MTEQRHQLFRDGGKPGLAELRLALNALLGGIDAQECLIDERQIKSHVYRLRFRCEGIPRSVIVKLMNVMVAWKNDLVVKRWLPAVGLGDCAPRLLAVAAERWGQCVWHIYEDLGDHILDSGEVPSAQLRTATELIAQLHLRFQGHSLLAQCRMYGGDLGAYFYASAVEDGARCLQALSRETSGSNSARTELLHRLSARIEGLRVQQRDRLCALAEFGGPETLLHGDLWPTNLMVIPGSQGPTARIIDWDRAAVGPVSYDISTFLVRLPQRQRKEALRHYLECLAMEGWTFPSQTDWNLLFETAEYARLATALTWAAQDAFENHPDWAYDDLALIDQWFSAMEPVLDSPLSEEVCQ